MNTRQVIMDTAIDLFKKKNVDKISASDIIESAGVSRSTFYRYYKDKYDIIEKYLNDMAKFVLEKSNNENWYETHYALTKFATEHRELIKELLQHDSEKTTWKFLLTTTYKILKQYYKEDLINEQSRLSLIFATAGITECVCDWIMRDYDMDVQKFSNFISTQLKLLMR